MKIFFLSTYNYLNMNEQKIYFLTFGGPLKKYHDSVNRLVKQANEFKLFEKIYGLTELNLKNDLEFWNKHGEFLENNTRGYGYWLWKPYLIIKILNEINENDILLYCDCGCELNILGKDYMNKLFEKTNSKLIIGTQALSTDYAFTKIDIINYFKINNIEILKIPQMQAGCLMMKKCDIVFKLIEEWYDIMSNNYHLVDDSRSKLKNYLSFIDNRHDQSIFSMLVKKYKLINYDLDPTSWIPNKNFLINGLSYPIWYCRNKTGTSLNNLELKIV